MTNRHRSNRSSRSNRSRSRALAAPAPTPPTDYARAVLLAVGAAAALVFILGAVAPSCAGDAAPLRDCTPGASLACACVGGSTGAQLCDGAGHLEACVCPMADAGPAGDVVDAVALDAAPIVDAATDTAPATDHQSADVVDAAVLDAVDGARADSPDVVDAAPADAGPVTYDLASPAPGRLRFRVIARTSRGDCDIASEGAPGFVCTSGHWDVPVTCSGSSFVLSGSHTGDGPWSALLVESGGATDTASRVVVEARAAGSAIGIHARLDVPAGETRGATGIPGRTVAADTADVWLFGCTLGL
jgi:hypothetical protein